MSARLGHAGSVVIPLSPHVCQDDFFSVVQALFLNVFLRFPACRQTLELTHHRDDDNCCNIFRVENLKLLPPLVVFKSEP